MERSFEERMVSPATTTSFSRSSKTGRLMRVETTVSPSLWIIVCGGLVFHPDGETRESRSKSFKIEDAFRDLNLFKDRLLKLAERQNAVVSQVLRDMFLKCTDVSSDRDKVGDTHQTIEKLKMFEDNLISLITDEFIGGLMHSSHPKLTWEMDITDWDVSRASFRRRSEVDFTNAVLKGCDFTDSSFEQIRFDNADLTGACMKHCHFIDIVFDDCRLDGCDLSQCDFECSQRFLTLMLPGIDEFTQESWTEQRKLIKPAPKKDLRKHMKDNWSLQCVFGNVRSMVGCRIDYWLYQLNPPWFDRHSVVVNSEVSRDKTRYNDMSQMGDPFANWGD